MLYLVLNYIWDLLRPQRDLLLENLALRQQILVLELLQAFPFDSAPKYLIRDRDGIYGEQVQETIKFLGMKTMTIGPTWGWTKRRLAVDKLSRWIRVR